VAEQDEPSAGPQGHEEQPQSAEDVVKNHHVEILRILRIRVEEC
jgi:hypothetical protein